MTTGKLVRWTFSKIGKEELLKANTFEDVIRKQKEAIESVGTKPRQEVAKRVIGMERVKKVTITIRKEIFIKKLKRLTNKKSIREYIKKAISKEEERAVLERMEELFGSREAKIREIRIGINKIMDKIRRSEKVEVDEIISWQSEAEENREIIGNKATNAFIKNLEEIKKLI